MAKYRYEYTCPACGVELEFMKRVTLTKRRCPQCNREITPEEIDRQAEERLRQQEELARLAAGQQPQQAMGCYVLLGLLVVLVVVWLVVKSLNEPPRLPPAVPQPERNALVKPEPKAPPTVPEKEVEPEPADARPAKACEKERAEEAKEPVPKRPAKAIDVETKAAEMLKKAEEAAVGGNAALARVRCRLILEDYPSTKAAIGAKTLLDRLNQ